MNIIYEEFVTLPGSLPNETAFCPIRPGSGDHHLSVIELLQIYDC